MKSLLKSLLFAVVLLDIISGKQLLLSSQTFDDQNASKTVQQLIEDLQDEDLCARTSAVKSLRKIGPGAKEAIPALLEVMQDNGSYFCTIVPAAFLKMGPGVTDILEDILKDKQASEKVRMSAAQALGILNSNSKQTISLLIAVFTDKEDYATVRASACYSLGLMYSEAKYAIPIIKEAFIDKNENQEVRFSASQALSQMYHETKHNLPVLMSVLKDNEDDTFVRAGICRALVLMNSEFGQIIPALLNISQKTDEKFLVRAHAIDALGRIKAIYAPTPAITSGMEQVIPVFIKHLQDENENEKIRAITARVMGVVNHNGTKTISVLVEIIQDKNENILIRVGAIQGVAAIDPAEAKKAIPVLKESLQDKDERIRKLAAQALKRIEIAERKSGATLHNEAFQQYLQELCDEDIDIVLESEVEDISHENKIECKTTQQCIEQLKNGCPFYDMDAIKALERIRPEPKEVLPALLETIQAKKWPEQKELVFTLCYIDPEFPSSLPDILQNKKSTLKARRSAAQVLGILRSNTKQVIPVLVQILHDKNDDEAVRSDVCEALGHRIDYDHKELIYFIIQLFSDVDEDVNVRISACHVLGSETLEFEKAIYALIDILHKQNDKATVRRNAVLALWDQFNDVLSLEEELTEEPSPYKETIFQVIMGVVQNDFEAPDVRGRAAGVLGKMDPQGERAMPILMKILSDKEQHLFVRIGAAQGLAEIGPAAKEAIPFIEEMTHHKEEKVRILAAQALKKIKKRKKSGGKNQLTFEVQGQLEYLKSIKPAEDEKTLLYRNCQWLNSHPL